MKNKYQKVILNILGSRPIMFNPDLARALGSVNAGLFMSQLLYWWNKGGQPFSRSNSEDLKKMKKVFVLDDAPRHGNTARKVLSDIGEINSQLDISYDYLTKIPIRVNDEYIKHRPPQPYMVRDYDRFSSFTKKHHRKAIANLTDKIKNIDLTAVKGDELKQAGKKLEYHRKYLANYYEYRDLIETEIDEIIEKQKKKS